MGRLGHLYNLYRLDSWDVSTERPAEKPPDLQELLEIAARNKTHIRGQSNVPTLTRYLSFLTRTSNVMIAANLDLITPFIILTPLTGKSGPVNHLIAP
jgi:hypothetical protein